MQSIVPDTGIECKVIRAKSQTRQLRWDLENGSLVESKSNC
ncbi:Uncharacterized protein APZ42_014975 [Daphnia magna]|uniref:Uncharacterized protein n=1 Tax=Daphnia magna TaxID=35525 RepID=A0A162P2L9_9CRUS|nr:Uncharacterized protein APZ42_014975 [Daphnia magna]